MLSLIISVVTVVIIGGLGLACMYWCDCQPRRDPDDDNALFGFWRGRKP